MPAKIGDGGVTVDDVERKLPKGFFVRRGHIRDAFNLSDDEIAALIPAVFKPINLPPNKRRKRKTSRAAFVRSQVIAVARKWEAA